MRHHTPNPSRLTVLRAIPLFRSCSDHELGQVDSLVVDIDVIAGEILTREGHYEPQSFIIVSGEATVTRSGELLATLRSGDFFGEMALLDGAGRTATVTAQTPMHLLVLDPRSFRSLLDIGGAARVMLRGVVERLRRADEAHVSTGQ